MDDKSFACKIVFIGNLSFDTTETQLADKMQQVGKIVNLRIVADRDTMKPKGYGYVEYGDVFSAQSAVKHLNGSDLNNRILKISYADSDEVPIERATHNRAMALFGAATINENNNNNNNPSLANNSFNPNTSNPITKGNIPRVNTTIGSMAPLSSSVPPPMPVAPQQNAETIASILKKLNKTQLLEILGEIKKFIVVNREGAKQLLNDSPAVAQAVLQILFLFNLVKPNDILAFEASINAAYNNPNNNMVMGQGPMVPMNNMNTMNNMNNMNMNNMNNMGPVGVAPSVPPPMTVGAGPSGLSIPPQVLASLPPSERAILEQVIKFTPEQIAQLPPPVQQQISALFQQLGIRI